MEKVDVSVNYVANTGTLTPTSATIHGYVGDSYSAYGAVGNTNHDTIFHSFTGYGAGTPQYPYSATIVSETPLAITVNYTKNVTTTIHYVVDTNGNAVGSDLTSQTLSGQPNTTISVTRTGITIPTGYTLSGSDITSVTFGTSNSDLYVKYTIDYSIQYQNDSISIGSPVKGGSVPSGTIINAVNGLINAPANHTLSFTAATIDRTHTSVNANYVQDTGSVVIQNYLVNSSGQPIKADGITASSEATAQAIGSVSNLSPVNAGEPFSIIKGDENYAKLTLAGGYSIYGEGPYVLQTVTKGGTVYLYVPYTQTVTINITYVDSKNAKLAEITPNSYTVGDNFPTFNTDTNKTFSSKTYKYVSKSPASIPSLVSSSPANVTIQYSDLYSYTVNYHYNDDVITLNGQAEFGESIPYMTHPSELDGSKVGFTFKNVDTEKTITENESANVLNVYFGNQYTFSVRYTENGTDFGKEPFTSAPITFGTSMIANKVPGVLSGIPDGYKLNSITVDGETIVNPANVTDVLFEIAINQGEVAKNVVVVDYTEDSFDYKVLYYYDATLDTTKTVTSTGIFGTAIPNAPKPKDGYKLDSTANTTGTITSNADNNIVTYSYIKDNFGYKVNYSYNDVIDDTQTVVSSGKFGDLIPSVSKPKDGYKLVNVINAEGTITTNSANNVVTYVYVKDSFAYTVLYKYDGTVDSTKTTTGTGVFGDAIPNVAQPKVGYKLDSTINKNGTVTSNTANNVITYNYVKDTFNYTVLYVNQASGTVIATNRNGSGIFDSIASESPIEIIGYAPVSTASKTLTIGADATANVITFYYTQNVVIIDDSTPAAPAPATPTTTVTIPSTGTPVTANPHTGDNASALPIVAALFSIMSLLALSIRKVVIRLRTKA